MKRSLSTFLFLYLFTCFLTAENHLVFDQISMQHGLSQNTVRAILVDRKGFVWAGTVDGLNRYDGYHFINYKPQLGNPNSLVDHRIKDVFQDRDGYLWIKTYKDVFCCYNPKTDSFVTYTTSTDASLYTSLFETSNGDIWLSGDTHGMLRIRKDNGIFTSSPFKVHNTVGVKKRNRFLFEDSKQNIWFGGDAGLYRVAAGDTMAMQIEKEVFLKGLEINNKLLFITATSILQYDQRSRRLYRLLDTPGLQLNNMTPIAEDQLLVTTRNAGVFIYRLIDNTLDRQLWMKDTDLSGSIDFIADKSGGVWLYNHSGVVWYYNGSTGKMKKMELIPPRIAGIIDNERYCVFEDSKGFFWITTYGNGLWCYDPQTDQLNNYKHVENSKGPASNYLLSIDEDRFGNIWIGSEYAGVIKVTRPNYEMRIVHPEEEISLGTNNNVRAVFADSQNDVWIGTKNGSLYVYNGNISEQKYKRKDLNPYAIIEDAKQRVWIGTKGQGLYILDNKNYKEIAHFLDGNSPEESVYNAIFNILRDNKGRMWLASFGGGISLGQESEGKISFKHFFQNKGNLSYVRCLYQDSKGQIWAATSEGIIRFDPDSLLVNPEDYTIYTLDINTPGTLNCRDVKTVYEDLDGDIWIGTAGGGLNKYVEDPETGKASFIAYTTGQGLAGDIVSGIMEDDAGFLWVSTENGITRFDKKTGSMTLFLFSEKTYGNHFNENAHTMCRDGNMLWGSLDGLLIFNPKSFVPNENTPPVTLTGFSLYDQRVKVGEKDSPLKQAIDFTDELTLNYKQNTFTIEFATLSLGDTQKNKYIYMLENYDKKWSQATQYNAATYKNLPPGRYVFKVKGTNSDGIWSKDVTEITLCIQPPFWKSDIAYLIYFLLFIVILFVVFRVIYKFSSLNNDIRMEKQLTNHKLRFFTNISHEFRTPLTLIRGAVENLREQTELTGHAQKQLTILTRNSEHLTRLIEQLLEFRKIQNNVLRLDLEETDIVSFAHDIYAGFQDVATQKNIDYTFSSNLPCFKMFIDRRKVDKMFYNLLSNAFKFTPKEGKVSFRLMVDENTSSCTISIVDSGIGIEKEKQHLLFSRFMQINFSASGTGVGLSLVKEFVDVHKGTIRYDDNPEGGSVFTIILSTDASVYEEANFITGGREHILAEKIDDKVLFPSDSPAHIQLPEIDDATLANYKMLIIDDNDDIRSFLQDEFSKYFLVDTAENGRVGLEKATQSNPDLIICDVMMPEMDGFEVTRLLKEDFQTCHIPVILLTAHSSQEHQLEGIQSGADSYIMKPFSLKYLVARVFKLIEQRELLKKRFSNEFVLDGQLITNTDKDKAFFELIDKIIDEHLSDSQFSVDRFAELAKLRRTIFYKKVKGVTGFSPNELIRIKRMKKAAALLLEGELTVSEVSYRVGFEDPFYFSKCFKAHYNCSPSKYGRSIKDAEEAQ